MQKNHLRRPSKKGTAGFPLSSAFLIKTHRLLANDESSTFNDLLEASLLQILFKLFKVSFFHLLVDHDLDLRSLRFLKTLESSLIDLIELLGFEFDRLDSMGCFSIDEICKKLDDMNINSEISSIEYASIPSITFITLNP